MENIIEFVKSDIGVTLAWIWTVASTLFALITLKNNKQLKIKIGEISIKTPIDNSQDRVNQYGQKNVYTKNNSGGMKIEM